MTAPGVVTAVATDAGEVIGFARMLTDGELQAHLCEMAVARAARGQGIGKKLTEEAFARSGAQRVDLLALEESKSFYRSFPHREMPGYRIYPGHHRSDK